jgi:hypothetical protein
LQDAGAEVSVDGDTSGAIVQKQSIEGLSVITFEDLL